MNAQAIFGLAALMSLVSSTVTVRLFAWPWLRAKDRNQALLR